MTTTQVLEDYTRDDVIHEIRRWTDRQLSEKQFYKWLPYCLIPEPKPIYTKRDVKKFLFISFQLKRIRSLEIAKQKLIEHMEKHPEEYDL